MKGIHSIRRLFNRVARFFVFGYVGGNNTVSLKAEIAKNINLRLGRNVSVGDYAKLLGHAGSCIEIGEKSYIEPFVNLRAQHGFIKIGINTGINLYTVIYGAGGVTIGNNTRIACHTVIVSSNHNFDDLSQDIYTQGITAKGIIIGDDVWIGAGVRILDGVHVGNHAVVGAGSVVTKDIPENSVAVGVPARVIRMRGIK